MSKPVAGVRVGFLNGQYVVNPTVVEMEESMLDLVVAGTADAVLMIEASSWYLDFSQNRKIWFAANNLLHEYCLPGFLCREDRNDYFYKNAVHDP